MTTPQVCSLWPTIVGGLLALSGWGKVWLDWISARPKVRGRILNVIKSSGVSSQGPLPEGMHGKAWFFVYAYLVNQRKGAIHILDYRLEIRVDGKWAKADRIYKIHVLPSVSFEGIQIENFLENLIYRKEKPVDFGRPLHGWIVFTAHPSLYSAHDLTYRLTCTDAFQRSHRITTREKEFPNFALWSEIAGIEITSPRQSQRASSPRATLSPEERRRMRQGGY